MTDHASRGGLARNTANYGDKDFALYLRWSFGKSMGHSQAMPDRPVVGIVDTGSAYNNCHRTVPALIEAGEARRVGRRRYTDAVPDGVPMRAVAVSDVHALSEPGGTGYRGDADRSATGDRSSARRREAGAMSRAIALPRKGNSVVLKGLNGYHRFACQGNFKCDSPAFDISRS
jgi:hypothetical protein